MLVPPTDHRHLSRRIQRHGNRRPHGAQRWGVRGHWHHDRCARPHARPPSQGCSRGRPSRNSMDHQHQHGDSENRTIDATARRTDPERRAHHGHRHPRDRHIHLREHWSHRLRTNPHPPRRSRPPRGAGRTAPTGDRNRRKCGGADHYSTPTMANESCATTRPRPRTRRQATDERRALCPPCRETGSMDGCHA